MGLIKLSSQLLYVALSRVTTIEGLFTCTLNGDLLFHHKRKINRSVFHLQEEFQKLFLSTLLH